MKDLPKKFYQRLENIYSKNDLEIILNWYKTQKRKVSFRVNSIKSTSKEIEKVLSENNISFEKKEFLRDGYILTNWSEKDLWDLDIFKDWKIYMQSISSQIPALFMDLKENSIVLDTTSAPWSKTSQIATYMSNSWEIYANDNNAIRIQKLDFTLKRQWITNTKIIKNDATKLNKVFENETFDAILADLPCSAEWRINLNNEKSFGFWNEENIKKNANLQIEILKSIVPLLKKWWNLVYSTCTLAPEENEEIVLKVLELFPELELCKINLDYENSRVWITKFFDNSYKEIVKSSIRCLPSIESEWFYIAKFIKK